MPAHPLNKFRRDYGLGELLESSVDPDPIKQFSLWFDQAVAAELPEPNAMTLATADASGLATSRVLLLKGFDAGGFVFFTNYDSRKGKELAVNPRATMLFFWQPLERQVRVEGSVARVSRQESEEYFHSRPRLAQIAAWVSRQDAVLSSRQELEERTIEMTAKFSVGTIPLPEYWGGYRLTPTEIEFWQGRPSRLHDRLVYSRQAGGSWTIRRLSP
jgi:pyridoxamine 5'-phosphate oxidase